MEKESKGFKDINKLFGMDPTSVSDDFEVQLVNLISGVVGLNKDFLHRLTEMNSKYQKSFDKIADTLIIIDRRVTDIEYKIFNSDEDTTL